MTRRVETDGNAVHLDRPVDRLPRLGEILAIPDRHNVERLLAGEHRAMAGPCMVRMSVRDKRLGDGLHRIDVEIPDWAVEPFGSRDQDVFEGGFTHRSFHIAALTNAPAARHVPT